MSYKVIIEVGDHRLSNPKFTATNIVGEDGRKMVQIAAVFTELNMTLPQFLTFEGEVVIPAEPTPESTPAPEAVEEPSAVIEKDIYQVGYEAGYAAGSR